jgi:radical SAM superfamily enzyme YgiQ (UPF0313 family)
VSGHNAPAPKVLLINTYDLGRQPFGLASAAAWLADAGFAVDCLDLSRGPLDAEVVLVRRAQVVAFYTPMHTATRLALDVLVDVRQINPAARICFYGLYGQANAPHLLAKGADAVISGEFEAELVRFVRHATAAPRPSADVIVTPLERLEFRVPDRSGLPPLAEYAQLAIGDARRVVGYTEATRGCRHLCRHCPVAPVYQGRVRVVQADIVSADIDRQVAAGAQHITFGDPDFFNAPAHAMRVVTAMHGRHPDLTYDVTIKVEHLLRHDRLLPALAATGCLFITTAVESLDDRVLAYLDKGHTRADFYEAARRCAQAGVGLNPTFVAFHPWTTRESILDIFTAIEDLRLVGSLASIQLTTRLLVPQGSLLLDLPELAGAFGEFDPERLVYPWAHPDPAMDALHTAFESEVAEAARMRLDRYETFERLRALAGAPPRPRLPVADAAIPQFLEPWFCCSEPVNELLTGWSLPSQPTPLHRHGGNHRRMPPLINQRRGFTCPRRQGRSGWLISWPRQHGYS